MVYVCRKDNNACHVTYRESSPVWDAYLFQACLRGWGRGLIDGGTYLIKRR